MVVASLTCGLLPAGLLTDGQLAELRDQFTAYGPSTGHWVLPWLRGREVQLAARVQRELEQCWQPVPSWS